MASDAGEKGESSGDAALPSITVKFTSSDKAAGKVEMSLDSSVADLKTAIRLVGMCEHGSISNSSLLSNTPGISTLSFIEHSFGANSDTRTRSCCAAKCRLWQSAASLLLTLTNWERFTSCTVGSLLNVFRVAVLGDWSCWTSTLSTCTRVGHHRITSGVVPPSTAPPSPMSAFPLPKPPPIADRRVKLLLQR